MDGHGRLRSANGHVFVGSFARGMKTGRGVYLFGPFWRFVGSWREDRISGEGTYFCGRREFASGSFAEVTDKPYVGFVYSGTTLEGVPWGRGVAIYSEGAIYRGGWRAGVRSGWGVLEDGGGTIHWGSWRGDKRSGRGVVKHRDGSVFKGAFVADAA